MSNKARRWITAALLGVVLPLGPAIADVAASADAVGSSGVSAASVTDEHGGAWGLLGLFGLLGLLGLIPRKQPESQTPPELRPRRRANPNVASPLDNYPVMSERPGPDSDAAYYDDDPALAGPAPTHEQPYPAGRHAGEEQPYPGAPAQPGHPAQPRPAGPGYEQLHPVAPEQARPGHDWPTAAPTAEPRQRRPWEQGPGRPAQQPDQAPPQTGDTPEGGHRRV
ncbi:hypothetical protein [Amycolatopsis sp.]|uniref:hypothetical protein n=1 Tax=Amycolatopsis sp. TaxID=37632 RepID=UPI002C5489AA|nr:hypothetical protein [Amycolatopsis sp.]HVV14139.1 hypothetical protein [Amycolatopsis sp.]